MGDINVYSGPMKCGKSMQILTEFNRQLIAGKNAMIFKPRIDSRAGKSYVATRDGKKLMAQNIEDISELEVIRDELLKAEANVTLELVKIQHAVKIVAQIRLKIFLIGNLLLG